METAKTSCNGTGTEANHDGEGKSTADDKKARMINKLVDFYTAAAGWFDRSTLKAYSL